MLQKVVKKYDMKLVAFEGGSIELPGTRNDTLYITHIRNPKQRALVEYKYSGRWDCQWLVYKHKRKPRTWEPTEENANSIEKWISRAKGCKGNQFMGSKLWKCSSNCFVRWLNHPNGHCDAPESYFANRSLYQSALGIAQKFHLIIQTEKLHDKGYVELLENYFGLSSIGVETRRPMFCDAESKAANVAYPLKIS
eukprot:CAMPEP_0113303622 /NCGR_PEP_ID=MMETSP0010_2-20120614/3962_1 /TAXON_ID=216773 ORGANISM="Corethron hystrix, Strain 308" /NCGR_SAMPLE_ID=MMETSP0010_2 /ASSEMBLY_ACC=CAM_ASM_000155 /LENGTH=194 /DNA_ID=CAMNT_0000157651 /DNA_START=310 /DNA_END=891 /DNA_ORIENTATION=+ /assembly_acc=CAM_ASM_000155